MKILMLSMPDELSRLIIFSNVALPCSKSLCVSIYSIVILPYLQYVRGRDSIFDNFLYSCSSICALLSRAVQGSTMLTLFENKLLFVKNSRIESIRSELLLLCDVACDTHTARFTLYNFVTLIVADARDGLR